MAPESRTESELTLPKDLLSEVQRQLPERRGDFQVEGWKPVAGCRMFGFLGSGSLARVTRRRLSLWHERRAPQVVAPGL